MFSKELEQLAMDVQVEPYDLLLVGDGSGTTIGNPSAWYVTSYDTYTGNVERFFGGANTGTNNVAELMPYVIALWHYHGTHTVSKTYANRHVSIISDSEITVRCGNGEYGRTSNQCFWAAIEWFERAGYRFSWHHVRRNTNSFSKEADRVAGLIRKRLIDFNKEFSCPRVPTTQSLPSNS